VACWSTKAAISLKRVKIEENLLWRYYRKSQPLFRTVPSRSPMASRSPKNWGFATTPKTSKKRYRRNGWSYELQIWPIHSQGPSEHKPMKNFGEKGTWAYPGTAQIFGVPLLSQERVQSYELQIWQVYSEGPWEQNTLKFGRKCIVGVSRDCPNFLSTPYYLRNGQSYELEICPRHSQGPCEQKPIKNLGENVAWAYSWTAQIFWVSPIYIISGTSKAH